MRIVLDGKSHCFSAPTMTGAQAKANAFVAQPSVSAKSPTVKDSLAEWLTRKKAKRAPQTVRHMNRMRVPSCRSRDGTA